MFSKESLQWFIFLYAIVNCIFLYHMVHYYIVTFFINFISLNRFFLVWFFFFVLCLENLMKFSLKDFLFEVTLSQQEKNTLNWDNLLKDGPRLCTPNIFCIFFHFPIEFSGNLERKVFYSLHKCSSCSSSIIYDCHLMEDMILILYNIHLWPFF